MNTNSSRVPAMLSAPMPHQEALVETILEPSEKPIILFRAPVGMGKTSAILEGIRRLHESNPQARFLYLAPRPIVLQVVERLMDSGVPALQVDRFRFRELLDAAGGKQVWPEGYVFALGADFAKQSDVAASLEQALWDLMVVEEGHTFTASKAELLKSLFPKAKRVVFELLPALPLPPYIDSDGATLVDWSCQSLIGQDGKPLVKGLGIHLHLERYELNAGEREVRVEFENLREEAIRSRSRLLELAILALARTQESSIAAFERALVGFRNQGQDESATLLQQGGDLEGEGLDETVAPLGEAVDAIVRRILQKLEGLDHDSKLTAFANIIASIIARDPLPKTAFVVTEYLQTLYYLAAELEDHDLPVFLLHGRTRSEERRQIEENLPLQSCLVLATRAALQGLEFPGVTDLILFEVPQSEIVFQQLISRFNRFGRSAALTVHLMAPLSEGEECDFIKRIQCEFSTSDLGNNL